MRYLLFKNRKLYKLFFRFELKRLQLRIIWLNQNLPNYIRQEASNQINRMKPSASFVFIRNRCFMSNRSRAVSNYFRVSRIKLRMLISNNYFNGARKSSW